MFKQFRTGTKTVATAGTQLALTTSKVLAKNLIVKAPAANAGVVYLGDSTVDATTGYAMAAGESVSFGTMFDPDTVIDLSRTYVDAATNGDKVTFVYLEDYNG